MPSTNGHGPKTAILYARVSTEEQARTGYSLAQQIEALRAHAAREGYEILEEVSDPGQSGASLARPGMDRVRDLVAEGGVSVVLAQDRDRVAREPAYHYLLKQEFAKRGCKIRAMNDRGDETPEGELTDGILDQLAKFERAKIAERTRRGKTRKAREGRAVTPTANYGFRFNEAKDGLVVHEPEMRVVERVFGMAAEGLGVGAIQSRLYAEGIPAPRGGKTWARPVIRRLVESDVYKPHPYEEIARMVSAEALARLDAGEESACSGSTAGRSAGRPSPSRTETAGAAIRSAGRPCGGRGRSGSPSPSRPISPAGWWNRRGSRWRPTREPKGSTWRENGSSGA